MKLSRIELLIKIVFKMSPIIETLVDKDKLIKFDSTTTILEVYKWNSVSNFMRIAYLDLNDNLKIYDYIIDSDLNSSTLMLRSNELKFKLDEIGFKHIDLIPLIFGDNVIYVSNHQLFI